MRRLLPPIACLLVFAPLTSTASANGLAPLGQSPPINSTVPSISGTAAQGQTLTAGTGSWQGPVATYSYQWQRCASSGTSCAAIVTGTGSTELLGAGDVGGTLRVSVIATNKNGSTLATSAPTRIVTPMSAVTSTTTTTTTTPTTTTTTPTTTTTTPTTTTTQTTTTTPTTTTTTTTPTTTTPTTSSAYFSADPGAGNLAPWNWFNPGPGEVSVSVQPQGATTPGIVRASSSNGIPAYQLTATPTASASLASGSNAVWLWNNDKFYDYSGQTTWYHVHAYFPSSGFIPTTGEWNVFIEDHNDGGYAAFSCSQEDVNVDWRVTTNFPVVTNQVGVNPHLKMRVMGGPTCLPQKTWYDFGSLQLNHWYDILYEVAWSPASSTGQVNAWIDGTQVAAYRGPTLYTRPNGSISHTNFELVNYRLAANWNSTIYFGKELTGPTRTSVGG